MHWFLQKDCISPQKKEMEDQQSTKPQKKRKVSLATPAAVKRNCCYTDVCLGQNISWMRFFFREKRKLSRTSWPPLSRSRAVGRTCRTWLLSTSQTSAQWSSWRSSNWRVSRNRFTLTSHLQSIPAELLRSPHVLPQTPVSCPVMTWHTHSPLIWNKVSHVLTFEEPPFFFVIRCLQPDLCVSLWLLLCSLFVSLSQVGKAPKAAHREEFSGCTHCLQLCASNHWTHQVGETLKAAYKTEVKLLHFLLKWRSLEAVRYPGLYLEVTHFKLPEYIYT